MIQRIQSAIGDKPQSEITMDDVAKAVTKAVGPSIPLDEDSAQQLERLAKQLMEQTGK